MWSVFSLTSCPVQVRGQDAKSLQARVGEVIHGSQKCCHPSLRGRMGSLGQAGCGVSCGGELWAPSGSSLASSLLRVRGIFLCLQALGYMPLKSKLFSVVCLFLWCWHQTRTSYRFDSPKVQVSSWESH